MYFAIVRLVAEGFFGGGISYLFYEEVKQGVENSFTARGSKKET